MDSRLPDQLGVPAKELTAAAAAASSDRGLARAMEQGHDLWAQFQARSRKLPSIDGTDDDDKHDNDGKKEAAATAMAGFSAATSPVAVRERLNRYPNVLAPDDTLVPVGQGGARYHNASRVSLPATSHYFIACQAPMEHTITDFWEMVWRERSPAIVMLTREVERWIRKADNYLPPLPSGAADDYTPDWCPVEQLPTLVVRVTRRSECQAWICHAIEMQLGAERHAVMHYQFLEWPDSGVPSDPVELLRLWAHVKLNDPSAGRRSDRPLVVHCSAGLGRTGAFMLLVALRDHLTELSLSRSVAPLVLELACEIRRARPGAIMNKDQFLFVLQALRF
jgi:protein tyrosine phosphatase